MRSPLLVAALFLALLPAPSAAVMREYPLPQAAEVQFAVLDSIAVPISPASARVTILEPIAAGGRSIQGSILLDSGLQSMLIPSMSARSANAVLASPRPARTGAINDVLASLPPVFSRHGAAAPLEALSASIFDNSVQPRAVALDTNALSQLIEGPDDPLLRRMVQSPLVRFHLSRQAIGEALNLATLPIEAAKLRRKGLQRLIERDKLFVSGISQMTPEMHGHFETISALLGRSLSAEDARVVADAIVKRVPLLSFDDRMADGLHDALRNRQLSSYLRRHGFPSDEGKILLRP